MIDLNQPQRIVVKTLAGCEALLEEELKNLGCAEVTPLTRAVMLEGTLQDVYKINYTSRFALSVLVNISNFNVSSYDDIYAGARKVFWHHFMGPHHTFAIRHAINSPQSSHTQSCALKVKDAIVDSFRERSGERPSVDKDAPDFIFHIHIWGEKCQLLIDTSGKPLYQRGYKVFQGYAPINEILAAAMVRWLNWDKQVPLVDPFCGSGTLLTEAWLAAINRPAGFYRKDFAFMRFKDFDRQEWEKIKTLFNEAEADPGKLVLKGFDINAQSVTGALKNIQAVGATAHVEITQADFLKQETMTEGVFFLTNPPYGKRIEPMDSAFFSNLSTFFKHKCAGSTVGIIAPKELISRIGFKPKFKRIVYNGEIECQFIVFELFKGSKKDINPKEPLHT